MVSEDKKERLDKLDNAFLFTISVVGLLVTIIQAYWGGKQGLVEAVPLLILAVPLPFYIGYLRGAISILEPDKQVVERLRGWGYLIVGMGAYISLLWDFPIYYFGVLLLSILVVFHVLQWSARVFDVGDNLTHQYAVFASTVSAIILAVVSRIGVMMYLDQWPFSLASVITFTAIWVIAGSVMIGLIFERLSRLILDFQIPLDDSQIQRRKRGNFFVRYAAGLHDLLYIALGTSKRASVLWVSGLFVALPTSAIAQNTSLADKAWFLPAVGALIFTSIGLWLVGTIQFFKTPKLNVRFLEPLD